MKQASPWSWIPSIFFAEGVPYMIITVVTVIMFKSLGMSNEALAFWTSFLTLPWILKPIWTPVVDLTLTKKRWVVLMQLLMGIGFAISAFALPLGMPTQILVALFMVLAFASSTHDAAADGFYIIALSEHDQALFSGIRSSFYRLAMISIQGGLVLLAGIVESKTGLAEINAQIHAAPPGIATLAEQQRVFDSGDIVLELSEGSLTPGKADAEKLSAFLTTLKSWNSGESTIEPNPQEAPEHTIVAKIALKTAPAEGSEPIHVSVGRREGSKNLALLEGGNLFFTSENLPRYAIFNADANLKEAAMTSFVVRSGNTRLAWSLAFSAAGIILLALALYHYLILPKLATDRAFKNAGNKSGVIEVFASFFRKKNVVIALIFILFYRFGEAQLVRISQPFILDPQEVGGMALTVEEVGFLYGIVGVLALLAGGILGGMVIARDGLGKWLLPMAFALNIPDLVYVYLAWFQPDQMWSVTGCIAIEQFGYGFGFSSYMLFLVYFAEDSGDLKTSHFAIMTGLMALGMMIPGMFSGTLQTMMGYRNFFLWVMIATIPGFIATCLAKRVVRPDFGAKRQEALE